jgi:transposase
LRRWAAGGGDAPVILVWDNQPAHTSLAMRAWLADQHAWLQVEYLPAYAADLNPVEGLCANLKGVELANRACGSLEELAAAVEQGIGRVRGEPELLVSFYTRQGFRCEGHPNFTSLCSSAGPRRGGFWQYPERQALPHRRWTRFDGYCPGRPTPSADNDHARRPARVRETT